MGILAERHHPAIRAIVQKALVGVELGIKTGKEEYAIPELLVDGVRDAVKLREQIHDRSANGDARVEIAGVWPDGLVNLSRWIDGSPRSCRSAGTRIVAQGRGTRAVQGAVLERREYRAVPGVGALVQDHVDHATQRAAILGLNARGLHLHFRDEIHGDVGMREAADDVGRFLAFNQVGVFRVCAAAD